MAGRVKHMVIRDGRHYARVVVPPELQRIIGKTELREPLGADKRTAERNIHAVAARLLDQIEQARQRLVAEAPPVARVARDFYARELERDDDTRALAGEAAIKDYNATFRNSHATTLRRLVAGRLEDEEAEAVLGWAADEIVSRGEASAVPSTAERRELLQALAGVKLEALARSEEQDRGQITPGLVTHPLLVDKPPAAPITMSDLGRSRVIGEHSAKTLSELLPLFHAERKVRQGTADEHETAVRMIEEFFYEPKPVCEITRQDLLAYKRALLRTPSNYTKRFPDMALPDAIEANAKRAEPFPVLSPNTITDKWLAHVRAILTWCVNEGVIPDNPAAGVKVDEGAGQKDPPRVPFSPGDLTKIFGPPLFSPGVPLETRQWVLLVALHTGARAAEIAQLRLDGIRHDRGVLVFEVDGVVKNNASRRPLPVHQRLIDLGLEQRIHKLRQTGETRLFPDWHPAKSGKFADTLPRWFNRTYLPGLKIYAAEKTFHSFRHTLKTALARAGVSRTVSDAITGHADGTAGGGYIHDVSLEAMAAALNKAQFDGIDWSLIGR